MSEWISVDDSLPKDFQDVLVFDKSAKCFKVVWMNSVHDWVMGVDIINADGIDFWQPLPPAPEEE